MSVKSDFFFRHVLRIIYGTSAVRFTAVGK